MSAKREKSFWLVFLTAYLAYGSIYVARLNFSVASVLLDSAQVLNKAQIGIIGGVFSFIYAIAKVPNGYIGDRLPGRKVIVSGLLIVGMSNFCIGFLTQFWSIAILWGLNAYGQSMLWGPLLRIFSETYGERKFKKITQFLISSVAVGSILGLLIASECAVAFGVSACFFLPGVIALFMAVLVKLCLPEAAGDAKAVKPNIDRIMKEVWGNHKFREIIFPTVAHGIIKDNINVWIAVYLIDTFGINVETITGYIFFVPAFAFVGRFLYPVFYRWLKDEYYVSSMAFGFCIIASVLICMDGISLQGALVCLGAFSALVSVINTHMLSGFPAEFSAGGNLSFVASIMDLLTYGGAGIGSLFFGILIESFGYCSMFKIWGAVSMVSIVILLYSRKRQET